jgi:hypothetical protein
VLERTMTAGTDMDEEDSEDAPESLATDVDDR